MFKVTVSVMATLEKLRFAVILYCLARSLRFPEKITAKGDKPADSMLGTGPHPGDISLC